ncbi:MAG: PKD domain-containing protein [Methanospirillum sp.]|uniref:PKD domain-containing protein n=1 Tax=Methanospirillum sp. TaxID=45200 RepID=UPI00236EE647|nr:PKD domain-containing protein [Methanospirillum sp.]MDD1729365.1 PKD domain-containing protein [Methanospirillum sp.]
MKHSAFFEKKKASTPIHSNLYLVLLFGCICVAGCGYATAEIQGVSDNSTSIRETIANDSIFDYPGLMPDIGYPEDLLMNPYPHIRSHERESAHNATSVSSSVSTPKKVSEIGSSEKNATDLQLIWQKCLGGSSYDMSIQMIQTSDGGYLMGGYTYSNDGDVSGFHGWMDLWIVKLDSSRNMVWQRCLGGSDDDYTSSIIQTTDGGYLVNGYISSTNGDVSGNHGGYDIWEVKLDSAGNITWQKCLGGSRFEHALSAIQTTDGGYLVNGYTSSTNGDVSGNHGGYDIWEVKLDSAGNITWQKCLGGTNNEYPYSVIQTTDGGYLVNGYTYSNDGNVTGNHGNWDMWEVKLDSSGDITWQKCLGGTSFEYPYSVIQTTDGGYLVNGCTASNDGNVSGNHGEEDIWEVKLDSAGDMTWQKCLGGTSSERAPSVIQTTDRGYLVNGFTESDDANVTGNHGSGDIWAVKLDSAGDMTWQKCLGGTDYEFPKNVFQTSDGGYLMGGITYSNDGDVAGSHGYADIWAVKLNSSGDMIWQKCLGGSSFEEPNAGMIQTADGRYLFGGFTDSSDDNVAGYHGGVDIWMALLGASHPVNATADSWTVAYPLGITSYAEGTNATYLAQAKPGADLVNVTVDDEPVGPVSNWTFSVIASNHTFTTTGQPTPGQVQAFFTQNTTWGAVPLTVQFTNQSLGDPTAFSWNFGDGQSSTEQNPVHTYMTPGTYSVTLRATNTWTGGIATLSNAVTATDGVVPSPTQTPVPGEITAAFSADRTSGAAPVQVSFLDQSTGNPTSWLWNLGDGTIAASPNVTHIYATKGTYSVSITAQNSLSSGSTKKSGYITVT